MFKDEETEEFVFEKGDTFLNAFTVAGREDKESLLELKYKLIVNSPELIDPDGNVINHDEQYQEIMHTDLRDLLAELYDLYKFDANETYDLIGDLTINLIQARTESKRQAFVIIPFAEYIGELEGTTTKLKILSFKNKGKEDTQSFYEEIRATVNGHNVKYPNEFHLARAAMDSSGLSEGDFYPHGRSLKNMIHSKAEKNENKELGDPSDISEKNNPSSNKKTDEKLKELIDLDTKIHKELLQFSNALREGAGTQEKRRTRQSIIMKAAEFNYIYENLSEDEVHRANNMKLYKYHSVGIDEIELERAMEHLKEMKETAKNRKNKNS